MRSQVIKLMLALSVGSACSAASAEQPLSISVTPISGPGLSLGLTKEEFPAVSEMGKVLSGYLREKLNGTGSFTAHDRDAEAEAAKENPSLKLAPVAAFAIGTLSVHGVPPKKKSEAVAYKTDGVALDFRVVDKNGLVLAAMSARSKLHKPSVIPAIAEIDKPDFAKSEFGSALEGVASQVATDLDKQAKDKNTMLAKFIAAQRSK